MTSVILQQPTEPKAARKPNRGFVHGLITNKKAMTGMAIMLVFIVLALAAPVLFPGDPSRITGMASLEPDGSTGSEPPPRARMCSP
jgi:peptide/nickel transport system permease protein